MARKQNNKMDSYLDEKEKESRGGGNYIKGSDVEFFSVKQKLIEIDIIPYEVTVEGHKFADVGETWYERSFSVHKNIGAEQDTVVCPKSVGHAKCPICEEAARLSRDPEATKEELKALRPSKRQLFNVLVDGKPALWDISIHLFGIVLVSALRTVAKHPKRPKPEVLGFFELEEGFVLECSFKKESYQGHAYYDCSRVDFFERDDLEEDLLDNVIDLGTCLEVLSYDELNELFLGIPSEDEGDDEGEEDEQPKRRSRRKAKTEEVSEEAEDEQPKRRSRRKAKTDDDEEEKPKRSRRSRKSEEDDEEEKPKRRSRRSEKVEEPEPEEEEEKPKRRSRKSKDTEEEAPKRSRRSRRGKAKEEEPEEEEEQAEEKPKRRSRRKAKEEEPEEEEKPKRRSRKSTKKQECPIGETFGDDCEVFEECEECKLWEACMDAKEGK